jgi:hypothetical protein
VTKDTPHVNSDQSPIDDTKEPQAMNPSDTDLPTWTVVYDDVSQHPTMLKNIEDVIRNFGVNCQSLAFDGQAKQAQNIAGQLLICLGNKSGSYFSGEENPVENLREIIFETTNQKNQEIPVVVSYSLQQFGAQSIKKKELWQDLIFARNVYLDTMSDDF